SLGCRRDAACGDTTRTVAVATRPARKASVSVTVAVPVSTAQITVGSALPQRGSSASATAAPSTVTVYSLLPPSIGSAIREPTGAAHSSGASVSAAPLETSTVASAKSGEPGGAPPMLPSSSSISLTTSIPSRGPATYTPVSGSIVAPEVPVPLETV